MVLHNHNINFRKHYIAIELLSLKIIKHLFNNDNYLVDFSICSFCRCLIKLNQYYTKKNYVTIFTYTFGFSFWRTLHFRAPNKSESGAPQLNQQRISLGSFTLLHTLYGECIVIVTLMLDTYIYHPEAIH